jgi:hypothetical protein
MALSPPENFTLGSCKEFLEMDNKGRFVLRYSNAKATPRFLTRRQASVWFAEHCPNELLGDAVSRAREWFTSRQYDLRVKNAGISTIDEDND